MSTIASKVRSSASSLHCIGRRDRLQPREKICTIANYDCRTYTSCWVCQHSTRTLPPPYSPRTGNDPELDPDRPADPPTRAIEKPVMRVGKRDGTEAPKPAPERQGNQTRAKQTASGNENGTSFRTMRTASHEGPVTTHMGRAN
jgi:hypothetical protein